MPFSVLPDGPVPARTSPPLAHVPAGSASDVPAVERSRYEQPASCRVLGSTGTMCLFAIALGTILWAPYAPMTRIAPAAPSMVTFDLAPAPAAPPAPPVDVPPGQAQREQELSRAARPPTESLAEPVVRPAEMPPITLSLPPPGTAPAERAADQASRDARAVERTTAPPPAAKPGPTIAAPVTSAAAEQAALADWQSQLLGHLKTYLRYPRQARRSRQEGAVFVTVTVDRRGNVLDADVDRGSGYPALDNEAVATVRRGSPVPPPTADIRGNPVTVTIPIQFSLRR